MDVNDIVSQLETEQQSSENFSNLSFELPSKAVAVCKLQDYQVEQLESWLKTTRVDKEVVGALSESSIKWKFTHRVLNTNIGEYVELSYSLPHKALVSSVAVSLAFSGIVGGQFPEALEEKYVWKIFFQYLTRTFAFKYEIKEDPITYEIEAFMRNLCRLPIVDLESFKDKNFGSKRLLRNVETDSKVTYRIKSCDLPELFTGWGLKTSPDKMSERLTAIGYKVAENRKVPGKGDPRRTWPIYLEAMEKFGFKENAGDEL